LFAVLAPHGCKDIPIIVSEFNPLFATDLFVCFPNIFGRRSTGSKQTSKGLFICISFSKISPKKRIFEAVYFLSELFFSESQN